MFTPLKQRKNELLHKLTHGALQRVMHTAWSLFIFFFLFQVIFVLCFKFISIYYHTQKQWKNKNYLR